jgi:glycosyltransferase involved in cell wall biosynthesis
MYKLGWTVIHYGNGGSEVMCTENVDVLSEERFMELEGKSDWSAGYNPDTAKPIYREWTDASIIELKKRVKPRDILCCTFGLAHVEQGAACNECIVVETGIGYPSGFANFQVFESHAWRNIYYGSDERKNSPRCYDMVIPNYLNMDEFPFQKEKGNYAIMLARPIPKKGSNVASDACKTAGVKLYIAGQGGLLEGVEAEHLGVLNDKERTKWVGGAMCYLQPTYYVEPFATAHIEAMALGTPVISTDFGVFPESVLHGITGYRFRDLKEFVWCLKNIKNIKPEVCRAFAENNFSMDKIALMYDDYFMKLVDLHRPGSKGFYELDNPTTNLDALYKYYPEGVK